MASGHEEEAQEGNLEISSPRLSPAQPSPAAISSELSLPGSPGMKNYEQATENISKTPSHGLEVDSTLEVDWARWV